VLWHAAFQRFWQAVATHVGLGDHGATLALFAQGETARHLLRWNRALDRALLEETVLALVQWLREERGGADHVRLLYRRLARAAYRQPARSDATMATRIEDAAAALLAERGHAGVTFRAVATRAGLTLGQAIHHGGTKSDLLRAGLHRLYEREALLGNREVFMAQAFPAVTLFEQMLETVLAGRPAMLAAYDEVELAIYNGPEMHDMRGLVRSMEDPSGTWVLTQITGDPHPPASLVAAFAAVVRGIGHLAAATGRDEAALSARAGLRPFLKLSG